jgi:hypothetical protein
VPFTIPRDLTLEFARRLEDSKDQPSEKSTWLLSACARLPPDYGVEVDLLYRSDLQAVDRVAASRS